MTRIDKRPNLQDQRSLTDATLVQIYLSSQAENRFARSLNQNRQSGLSVPDREGMAQESLPLSKASASQAFASRDAASSAPVRTNVALQPHKSSLSLMFVDADAAQAGLSRVSRLQQPAFQAPSVLQSSRAQSMRAEIERYVAMAIRSSARAGCSEEFRWVLPPTLFPDTTIVLRREQGGWSLDVTVGDEDCRAVLTNGIAELRRQFLINDLGDLVVGVTKR